MDGLKWDGLKWIKYHKKKRKKETAVRVLFWKEKIVNNYQTTDSNFVENKPQKDGHLDARN